MYERDRLYSMVIWVVKFLREGYKIRSIFGQTSKYFIEIIVFWEQKKTSYPKLVIILEKGVLRIEVVKNVNNKKMCPKNDFDQ